MRVLWFEVSTPKNYKNNSSHGGGWQDALERIVKNCKDIELGVAFEANSDSDQSQVIDGVYYFPLVTQYSTLERIRNLSTWEVNRKKVLPLALKVINEFQPDIIQVFGSEWCFGLVSKLVNIPVVIHIQGSIPPYNNAFYPPGYNKWDEVLYNLKSFSLKDLLTQAARLKKRDNRKLQEEQILKQVEYFMGRTSWDKSIVKLYNPEAKYYYCSEALRPDFIVGSSDWNITRNKRLKLFTTGVSSLWKGLDTILRTAKLLRDREVEFDWYLAGNFNMKNFLEWKEELKTENLNIHPLGIVSPANLIELLLQTDIYVHTAYIDNSPNAICEAQYLGLPIIATYVGGIPSLLENGKDGLLVPANSPHILANEIIELSMDKNRQVMYSNNSRKRARSRHDSSTILNDLLRIYNEILNDWRLVK